jgi:drug/metabolite transporter superfamily protein YnfA
VLLLVAVFCVQQPFEEIGRKRLGHGGTFVHFSVLDFASYNEPCLLCV